MQLHHLKPPHRKYKKPRVGRGGKRGTFSGRGTKGQKARAGHRIRPAERDLIQRLPKLRGFKNLPKSEKPQIVNLESIEKSVPGAIINVKVLAQANLIRDVRKPVKILSRGELKRACVFEDVKVSKTARKKIEAAGGKIQMK